MSKNVLMSKNEKDDKEFNIFELTSNSVDNATVNKDTLIANFPVQWSDEITADSMHEHIQFIHDNLLTVGLATSIVAIDASEVDQPALPWEGQMDLGGLTLHAIRTPAGSDGDYGITKLSITHQFNADYSDFEKEFQILDATRCKELFKK